MYADFTKYFVKTLFKWELICVFSTLWHSEHTWRIFCRLTSILSLILLEECWYSHFLHQFQKIGPFSKTEKGDEDIFGTCFKDYTFEFSFSMVKSENFLNSSWLEKLIEIDGSNSSVSQYVHYTSLDLKVWKWYSYIHDRPSKS